MEIVVHGLVRLSVLVVDKPTEEIEGVVLSLVENHWKVVFVVVKAFWPECDIRPHRGFASWGRQVFHHSGGCSLREVVLGSVFCHRA